MHIRPDWHRVFMYAHNDLLQQYFQKKNIFLLVNWNNLTENRIEKIQKALIQLPLWIYQNVENDFIWIHRQAASKLPPLLQNPDAVLTTTMKQQLFATYEGAVAAFLNDPTHFAPAGSTRNWEPVGPLVKIPIIGLSEQKGKPIQPDKNDQISAGDNQPTALTACQRDILTVLLESAHETMRQVDISIASGYGLKTVRRVLAQLREMGLACRPYGPRRGEAITDAGKHYNLKKQP